MRKFKIGQRVRIIGPDDMNLENKTRFLNKIGKIFDMYPSDDMYYLSINGESFSWFGKYLKLAGSTKLQKLKQQIARQLTK